jgi:hypothetical protein
MASLLGGTRRKLLISQHISRIVRGEDSRYIMPCREIPLSAEGKRRLVQYTRKHNKHALPRPEAMEPALGMAKALRGTWLLDGKHDVIKKSGSWVDCQ